MADGMKTWTIERRGGSFVLMGWGATTERGPMDVRTFKTEAEAKSAAETESGKPLAWRVARGEEAKHDVVAAADV